MLFNTAATLSSLAFVTVDAASAITATPGSIKDCTDVKISGAWVIGSCLTDDGKTRVQSSVWLNTKITNSAGVLGWKSDGGYGPTCDDCKVIAGSSLNCQCHLSGSNTANTTLDLDEHIHNYNGHLLSDLSGTPAVPATSSLDVPTDFSWNITFANMGCYSTDPVYEAANCAKNITETDCAPNTPSFTSAGAPITCYTSPWPVSIPIWSEYEKLKVNSASKAIEFVAYDNANCTGTPIGSVTPEEDNTCKKFPKAIRGLAYKALWNADIS